KANANGPQKLLHKPSLKALDVAQAVKPAEPRFRLDSSRLFLPRSIRDSLRRWPRVRISCGPIPDSWETALTADGKNLPEKRRKAETTLGSAGLTACATVYMKVCGLPRESAGPVGNLIPVCEYAVNGAVFAAADRSVSCSVL